MTSHRESLATGHGFQTPFWAKQVTIFNPVNQWLYIRVGALDMPDAAGADFTVEPYTSRSLVLSTVNQFGVSLGISGVNTPGYPGTRVTFSFWQSVPQVSAYAVFYDEAVPVALAQMNPYPALPFTAPTQERNDWLLVAVGSYLNLISNNAILFTLYHPDWPASGITIRIYKMLVLARGYLGPPDQLRLSVEQWNGDGTLQTVLFELWGDSSAAGAALLKFDFDGSIPNSQQQGMQINRDTFSGVKGGMEVRIYNRGAGQISMSTFCLYELLLIK